MIPSVEQCKIAAAALLGDAAQRKFTDAKLQTFFELAWLELRAEMLRYHLDFSKNLVEYSLAANTTSLVPATAGISNMGEIILMEERPYGSSDRYTKVTEVDFLPQRDAGILLLEYQWRADQWFFVGATQAISLRIWYYGSGSAATTGTVGIDGCLQFIAHRMASLAAYPAGNKEMAKEYYDVARGPAPHRDGGLLHALLQPMVVASNKVQLQLPCYQAGGWPSIFRPTGLIVSSGGGDVGAPTTVTPTGTIDGANDTFTLTASPLHLNLYLNGILLSEGTAYTLAGSTITMLPGYIPLTGAILRAEVW